MAQDEHQRTVKVIKGIRTGLDQKLQAGAHERALEALRQAYELARSPTPLASPWPQITAYRLAHLRMRDGAATDWEAIDRLLEEAAAGDVLGPAPWIYRLIALSRCPRQDSGALQTVYEGACRTLFSGVDSARQVPRQHVGDQRALQPGWFNLLELAVYATGLPYAPLAGRGVDRGTDHFSDLGFESSAWAVVEAAGDRLIRYPETIARQRFRERSQALEDGLAIECVGPPAYPVRRLGGGGASGSICADPCRDLLSLIEGDGAALRPEPGSAAMDPAGAVRQRRKRLLDALRLLLPECDRVGEQEAFRQWWDDPRPERRPPWLPPVLLLVGPRVLAPR